MTPARKTAGELIYAGALNALKGKKTKALERSLGVSVSEQVYEELEKEMNQIDR